VAATTELVLQESKLKLRAGRGFWRRPEFWMVIAALVIRLAVMPFLIGEQLNPERDHWRFGYETGRIAKSIVEGHGFSSPLFSDTGPTAWMTPVYPYIVAGFFKVFGLYSTASAIALLAFNALISALTCIPIFLIARKTFGARAANWAGWLWVVFPYGIYFPMERIWETWLATLFLSILFLMALRLEERPARMYVWLGFGALWGLTALTSPTVLSVFPFLIGWICYRLARKREVWLGPLAVTIVALGLVVCPWFIRNYEVFHRFIPFRDNMGMVLRLGTKGHTSHWAAYELGPWHNQAEWDEFQNLGELGYMAKEKRQAMDFIKANPGWYVWTTMRRAVFLWTGYWSFSRDYLREEPLDPPNIFVCTTCTVLALFGLWLAFRRKRKTALPYAMVLFVFPAIYYITSPEAYYRRPIDPLFVVLIAYALTSSRLRRRKAAHTEEAEYEELLVT
jgi:4-amino-4-deoxy-L-arabinose transferase-like glycosyltransferase